MNIRQSYISIVKRNCSDASNSESDLNFWRNNLFATTIIYILPLSLIALLPGLYWICKIEKYSIGIVDILTVASIVIVAFVPRIDLVVRKRIFISCAYTFSFAILYFIGLNAPGLIYLLATCIFSILIFSTDHLFWPAWLNALICIIFGFLIWFDFLPKDDPRSNNIGEWIAVSTNLIFLSFLCASLIPRLFKGLQKAIDKEVKLKKNLEEERKTLDKTFIALQTALNENSLILDSSLDVFCAVDAEGRFVKVSAACEAVWGYRASELIGKRTIDFVYAEDHAETKKTADNVLAGINAISFENRYVHKNGTLVPTSWSVRWDENDKMRYGVARDITLKKKLEKDLELERKRFYDLFLEAPVCMGVLSGIDHVYEAANPPYLELIGKKDIIGRPVAEVLPEVIEQGFITKLDMVYRTGVTFSANEMVITLQIAGQLKEKYLNFSYQAHRDAENNVVGIFFFAVDVTEQVLSRKKIEVSEVRLKESQRIAHLGSWEIDMVSNTHSWSDELYKLFMVKRGEINPSSDVFLSFIHPEDLEYVQKFTEDASSAHIDSSFDFRYITSTGLTRYGHSVRIFEFDGKGNPVRIFGILQDVTEQKEAEQQLRNSESFSRGVLDSLASNIAVIDLSGNIIAVNKSWNTFGHDNGAASLQSIGMGSNYFDVCGTVGISEVAYAKAACQGIKEVMNDIKEIFYMEYPCDSLEENRWFGMRVTKFEGNQSLVVISHQNISERKLAEFKLTKVADDLIRRNKDLEQFTFIVSHNLRAPVANILGLVNLWKEPGLNIEETTVLNKALYESVNKLDEVVKDLNQILQIRGAINESTEVIHFSRLVENIKTSIKNLINNDRIDIQYDFTEIDTFSSLKSYMHSIFYNLITNSIKYRQPEIPCSIKIQSHLTDRKMELIFTDNGLGIDLQKRGDQVFGLYKRFHSHVEGKGLGLFMTKTQVEKLGGTISVQSELNKGTRFIIEFEI